MRISTRDERRRPLAFAVLSGLAVLALPDVGEPAVDTTVVLLLATLPLTSAGIDRDAIVRQAGCEERAAITIVQESAGEPDSRWIVIVRCFIPVIPMAEILRTNPWEAPRQAQGPCMASPFAGWCADGSKKP